MIERTTFCEHAEIRVGDLGPAMHFYCDVMGLEEVARDGDRVFLSCGGDARFDLAVVPTGAGIEHFALLAQDADELDRREAGLREHDVATTRVRDHELGVADALQFDVPDTRHHMEFVVLRPEAARPDAIVPPNGDGFHPLGIDHVNIKVPDVEKTAAFMRDVVGLRVSDVGVSGDRWIRAWTRLVDHHHEVGLGAQVDDDETLSHLAFAMADVKHIQQALDIMAANGFQIESGIGRHRIGFGLFAYFREPGGNRFELSVESEIVDPNRDPGFYGDLDDTFHAWIAEAHKYLPPSFRRGS